MSADRRAWLVVVVGAVCAWPLWAWRGTATRSGTAIDAAITLITSDRDDLSCGLDRSIGSFSCAFGTNGQPARDLVTRPNLLAPYMTVARQLFLIPALFDQPAVAARYQKEPPAGVPRDKLRRFVARCHLRLVERVESVMVRWQQGDRWNPSSDAWVAQPSDCRVEN